MKHTYPQALVFVLLLSMKACQAAERSLKRTCHFSLHLLAMCKPKCLVNSSGIRSVLITLNDRFAFLKSGPPHASGRIEYKRGMH